MLACSSKSRAMACTHMHNLCTRRTLAWHVIAPTIPTPAAQPRRPTVAAPRRTETDAPLACLLQGLAPCRAARETTGMSRAAYNSMPLTILHQSAVLLRHWRPSTPLHPSPLHQRLVCGYHGLTLPLVWHPLTSTLPCPSSPIVPQSTCSRPVPVHQPSLPRRTWPRFQTPSCHPSPLTGSLAQASTTHTTQHLPPSPISPTLLPNP